MSTCEFQLSENDTCYSDFQCANNLGCNGLDIMSPGICTPYYSLPNGSPVQACIDNAGEGVSRLCTSGACILAVPGINGSGVCAPAFRSNAPISCVSSTDCVGSNGVQVTTKECVCGRSTSGGGFCPLFSGDDAVAIVTQMTIMMTTMDTSDCHTSGRFSPYCLAIHFSPEDYERYMLNSDLAMNYPLYQRNDLCVQANILNNYYDITAEDLSCPAYLCFGSAFPDSVCSAYSQGNNTVELNMCAKGDICSVPSELFTNGTCVEASSQPTLYAGESCNGPNQCIESSCVKNVCVGIASGKPCEETSQCDAGLYCSDLHMCEPLIKAGSYCLYDFMCQINSACHPNEQGEGICTPYFSLPNNSPVSCTASGYQPLCQSAMCLQGPGLQDGICIPAASIGPANASPIQCSADSDCVGYNGVHEVAFTSKCRCGYNPQGLRYCDWLPGDTAYTNYTKLISKVLSQTKASNIHCQTTRRFQPDCLALIQKKTKWLAGHKLLLAYYRAMETPMIQNNDKCVQNIFTPYYWSLISQTFSTNNSISQNLREAEVTFFA